jgi:imidazolonepropionase-like amidohydrolase
MHARQSSEFTLRGGAENPAQTPVQILQSATIQAARLMRQEGQIGQIVAGAWADLLMVDGDPTVDASVMAQPAQHIKLLMHGGRVIDL